MSAIPGFPGYEISTYGEVTSHLGKTPRVIRPHWNGKHYRVSLRRDGKTYTRSVHSLVALTYLGPRPEGHEVRHLDRDGSYNATTNLVYRPIATRSG
jgi:hypothetical protein